MQKLQENTLWELVPDCELEEVADDDALTPRVRFNQVPGLVPLPATPLESLAGNPRVGLAADTSPASSSMRGSCRKSLKLCWFVEVCFPLKGAETRT